MTSKYTDDNDSWLKPAAKLNSKVITNGKRKLPLSDDEVEDDSDDELVNNINKR